MIATIPILGKWWLLPVLRKMRLAATKALSYPIRDLGRLSLSTSVLEVRRKRTVMCYRATQILPVILPQKTRYDKGLRQQKQAAPGATPHVGILIAIHSQPIAKPVVTVIIGLA